MLWCAFEVKGFEAVGLASWCPTAKVEDGQEDTTCVLMPEYEYHGLTDLICCINPN